jgi:hypothetical protein
MSDTPQIFNLQGTLEKVSTRKGDKSLLISIATQETSPVKAGYIMSMQDQHIYFFMAGREFTSEEAMALPEPKREGQKYSQSQKLRFKLFDIHVSKGGSKETFDEYYNTIMEELIVFYETKLKEIKKI